MTIGDLTPHYSNRNSHKFWKRVNSLKGKDWDAAYTMGCALQSHEHLVLQFINEKPSNKGLLTTAKKVHHNRRGKTT